MYNIVAREGGIVLAPLDDAYIHFQYARQIAAGQLYVYNPGLPPTSGATSFLYPYVVAIIFALGDLRDGFAFWVMLLIGFPALATSGNLVYALVRRHAPAWIGAVMAALFIVSGPFAWHAMSGMETILVVLFLLWTLYEFVAGRLRGFIVAATLLALIRPEGGMWAALAVGACLLRRFFSPSPASASGVERGAGGGRLHCSSPSSPLVCSRW
ncbi:MAG: hypothetical protein HC828_21990 [Blastochloris sp.]|nr:hypothetical protein [Blastochloris sp.]